ncbi:MAG: DUF58 domain-containing protein [Gemmatimonadota bacterium]|nr:DUF58 domain-containing protein [Gemmatimonadota bacterium]
MKRIELATRRFVESLFSGEYHSIFKGRGLEFSDVREYQPGDDVRAIDWNVTARRGRVFLKEFVEERQLNALVIVDLSGSKAFGTGAKSNARVAAEIAAILALAATANNDRVGLLLVTDRVEYFVPPDTGRRHALRLVLDILAFRPQGRGTRLSEAFRYAEKVLRQRTTVFVISDFVTAKASDPDLPLSARKLAWDHDVVAIRLSDPAVGTLPNVGMMAVTDPETGARRIVNTSSPAVRARHEESLEAARSEVDSIFRDLRMDVVDVDTTEEYLPPLIGFFRRRARVLRSVALWLATAAAAALATLPAAAQVGVLDVGLSADTVGIGDRFELRFILEVGADAVAFFPDSLEAGAFESFEAVQWTSSPGPGPGDGSTLEVVYPLIAFQTGVVAVPEIDVFVAPLEEGRSAGFVDADGRVGSWSAFRESPGRVPSAVMRTVPEQRIWVASVFTLDDLTTQLAPRPAADVSGGDRAWAVTLLLAAFGVLFAGVVVASARDWVEERNRLLQPPPPDARARALAALDELHAADLHRSGQVRAFYAGWSDTIRRYVETFRTDWTPSWTSSELMTDLQGPRRSEAIQRKVAGEAIAAEMRLAEAVKFGGRRPDEAAAEEDWRAVRAWVESSQPGGSISAGGPKPTDGRSASEDSS